MSFTDSIIKLSKQLYPKGRVWNLFKGSNFYKLHEALAESENAFTESLVGILDSILPDTDNFTEEDATNWERALALFNGTGLTLDERKEIILRKMQHPGTVPARQHYLYLQRELRAAGFDVYVHENRILSGSVYVLRLNPVAAIYGNVKYGQVNYGATTVLAYTKIANYTDEAKDADFNFGDSINLRATFFIGGAVFGTSAEIPSSKKRIFRELILKIKPAQTAGFLWIDYISDEGIGFDTIETDLIVY